MAGDWGSIETCLVRLASMRKGPRGPNTELRENETTMQRRRNGLFDESRRMAQSSRSMKRIGILLAAVGCAFGAPAQDANLLTINTNLPETSEQYYAQVTNSVSAADASMKITARPMSLQDCIAMALKHNFTIQIARFNPALARYTLWGSYGVYDPTFTASYDHEYNLAPGGLDAQGRPFTGTQTEADDINSGLSGFLPWGLSYNLGMSCQRSDGLATASPSGTPPISRDFPPTFFSTRPRIRSFS